MPTCICQYCNTSFKVTPYEAKTRKYCSQRCMGDSYKAPLIETPCEQCGKATFRTRYQFDLVTHHYCSDKCARIASRETRKGSNNANWKGGSIESRGPHWAMTREQSRAIHGYKCVDCDMTNEQHIEKYNIELHVHHIIPYRLTQDNNLNNLEPLCISCHMKKEQAFNATITPLERALMEKNTEIARSKGLDKKRDRTVPCPTCDGRKTRRSKTCKKCWVINHPRRKPK